jgi:hypothetical protein
MHYHRVIPEKVFKYLCLLTALANAGGNVVILLFYRPILAFVGAPLPKDLHTFAFVSGFSFTIGILAFMVYLNPEKRTDLLIVGIIGKAFYALLSFYFYTFGALHPFFMIFAWWDAAYVIIFFLFYIQLVSPDLTILNRGEILEGGALARANKALLLYFSMTGNGAIAMNSVKKGLEAQGYTVDEKIVEPTEPLFHFPFSFLEFLRILVRAVLRIPTTIKPLDVPADHDYDLVIVESQTWFVGISAPVEAIFQSPKSRRIFENRDVAVVNVCRGLWHRPQAMLVRWITRLGGRVVGARAFGNPGREPMRTFALFFFLAAGKPNRPAFLKSLLPPQEIDETARAELFAFGERLAARPQQRLPGKALDIKAA